MDGKRIILRDPKTVPFRIPGHAAEDVVTGTQVNMDGDECEFAAGAGRIAHRMHIIQASQVKSQTPLIYSRKYGHLISEKEALEEARRESMVVA